LLEPEKNVFSGDGKWTLPAASVSAVELDVEL
jgi:hypothetical protein